MKSAPATSNEPEGGLTLYRMLPLANGTNGAGGSQGPEIRFSAPH